ncbi:MAG: hypothetical protein ABIP64_05465, partial [Burkholderiales bacterium]
MQGQLFSQAFLSQGIAESPAWRDLAVSELDAFRTTLHDIYAHVDASSTLNEAVTENTLILPTLTLLGWEDLNLPHVNSSAARREDVPDQLLFLDDAAKQSALRERRDADYYKHGVAIIEAKRWGRQLDRGDSTDLLDPNTPSSQMLRYLSRVEVASDRAVRWG